jgi:hypothetical protein
MDPLQTSILIITYTDASGAHSALPGAPVVPYRERRPHAAASRVRIAGALHRLADAVAPRPAAVARRRHVYAGGQGH